MASEPFRFLHAGGFHLHRTLEGLTEAPDHLRELLLHAPYLAVERTIDAAIGENVDFVVLNEDLARLQLSGPRAAAFLCGQFSRLAAHGIPIYWAAGDHDTRWPAALKLPDNVHVFAEGRAEEILAERHDKPLATIQGCSGAKGGKLSDFRKSFTSPFTIAVLNGEFTAEQLEDSLVDYWALGGRADEATLFSKSRVAHYPGSPQGRSPQEIGAHGCTLVRVGEDGRSLLQRIPTDAVRWRREPVAILAGATPKDLERKLSERARQLREDATTVPVLVSWLIEGDGTALQWARSGAGHHELIALLRREFAREDSTVWTVGVDVELPDELPEHWAEEQTLLGQFVEELRAYQTESDEDLDLPSLLPEVPGADVLRRMLDMDSPEERKIVLREAAVLGSALLRGDRDTA